MKLVFFIYTIIILGGIWLGWLAHDWGKALFFIVAFHIAVSFYWLTVTVEIGGKK